MSLNLVLAVFEFVVLVLALSVHDWAQAWIASRLGDPTARMLGRMTFNPMRHIDTWGTLIWPAVYVFFSPLVLGWSKPVPLTPNNFRNPERDEVLVYASGPVTYLLEAGLCMAALLLLKHTVPGAAALLQTAEYMALRVPIPTDGLPGLFPVVLVLYFGILTSLLLCVFNLIPLPMLDGGRILRRFLPYKAARSFDSMSIYVMILFMLVGFRIALYLFSPLLGIFDRMLTVL